MRHSWVSFRKAKPKTKRIDRSSTQNCTLKMIENDRNRDMYIYIYIIYICYAVYIYIEFLVGLSTVSNPIEMNEDRYEIKLAKTLFNTGIDI